MPYPLMVYCTYYYYVMTLQSDPSYLAKCLDQDILRPFFVCCTFHVLSQQHQRWDHHNPQQLRLFGHEIAILLALTVVLAREVVVVTKLVEESLQAIVKKSWVTLVVRTHCERHRVPVVSCK